MIARCSGKSCPIKSTCYRWVMKGTDDRSAWTQSMYSPLHGNCRNYWAIKSKEDKELDDHAHMLNSMIKRLNLLDRMNEKEKTREQENNSSGE